MKIGVDSCVIVAAVHANHPLNIVAAGWLNEALSHHELIVAHHSVLEAYAVLTRLPGDLRISASEARDILQSTVRDNMQVAEFDGPDIWDILDRVIAVSAIGGRSYDAFNIDLVKKNGADSYATFDISHFEHMAGGMKLVDPSHPE